uniref:Syntenin-1 n=1 Tax=Gopherus agassizii TaxID=38772 RepID=A0A452GZH0_9SAUR
MSLYPSLEDLKVDKVIQAQIAFYSNPANPAILSEASAPIPQDGSLYPRLYPELSEHMGLSLNEEGIHKNLPMVAGTQSQGQLVMRPSTVNYMVAPVTGNDVGIHRAEIKQGIHEITVCKDQDGKIGLHLKCIDNGIFVLLGFFSPGVLCSVSPSDHKDTQGAVQPQTDAAGQKSTWGACAPKLKYIYQQALKEETTSLIFSKSITLIHSFLHIDRKGKVPCSSSSSSSTKPVELGRKEALNHICTSSVLSPVLISTQSSP